MGFAPDEPEILTADGVERRHNRVAVRAAALEYPELVEAGLGIHGEGFILGQKQHLQSRYPGVRLRGPSQPFAESPELRSAQITLRHYNTVNVAAFGIERPLCERAVEVEADQVPAQDNLELGGKVL
jgi:hypothetical protein